MVRRFVCAAALAVAVVAGGRADDDARKVVEKAVTAHGGLDALKKHPAAEFKGEGTAVVGVETTKFTTTTAYALPDKFRVTIDTTVVNSKAVVVVIVNGDKVKQTVNGVAAEVKEPAQRAFKQLAAVQEASLIYPLLDADKFTLKAEKDDTIGGKETAVVLATRKGMKDLRLYFDKSSGLLVKYTRTGLDPGGKEVEEEVTASDYKEFSGVKVATVNKVKQAGKDYMTLKVTDVKFSEKADPKAFE
jgi:hypothetical protein